MFPYKRVSLSFPLSDVFSTWGLIKCLKKHILPKLSGYNYSATVSVAVSVAASSVAASVVASSVVASSVVASSVVASSVVASTVVSSTVDSTATVLSSATVVVSTRNYLRRDQWGKRKIKHRCRRKPCRRAHRQSLCAGKIRNQKVSFPQ